MLNLSPARYLGRLYGRPVYRFTVILTRGAAAAITQDYYYPKESFAVIAPTAADACNLIINDYRAEPCIHVETMGPKGGMVERYHGFNTAIMDRYVASKGN